MQEKNTITEQLEEKIEEIEEIEEVTEDPNIKSEEIQAVEEFEEMETYNLSNIKKAKASSTSRGTCSGAGVVTIVNSEKNGKRISFSEDAIEHLKNEESIQIGFKDKKLFIYTGLEEDKYYSIKKQGAKYIAYNSELVKEITKELELDFTERVSITLCSAKYTEDEDGNKLVVVSKQ